MNLRQAIAFLMLGVVLGIMLLGALCLGGCRSIHYTHKPDGTIEAVYNNFGFDTSVDGLTIKKNAEGVEVTVSKYNSQTQAFEMAGKALDLANKVAK